MKLNKTHFYTTSISSVRQFSNELLPFLCTRLQLSDSCILFASICNGIFGKLNFSLLCCMYVLSVSFHCCFYFCLYWQSDIVLSKHCCFPLGPQKSFNITLESYSFSAFVMCAAVPLSDRVQLCKTVDHWENSENYIMITS